MRLFQHQSHPHTPQNVNELIKFEQSIGSFNQKLAIRITQVVSTMFCAYFFLVLALSGFPGLHATLPQYVQWFSGTFLQLVMLPVLAVGTALLGHHQELQAEEQFRVTQKTYHNQEQIEAHLQAQDEYAIQLAQSIEQIYALLKTEKTQPLAEGGVQV